MFNNFGMFMLFMTGVGVFGIGLALYGVWLKKHGQ